MANADCCFETLISCQRGEPQGMEAPSSHSRANEGVLKNLQEGGKIQAFPRSGSLPQDQGSKPTVRYLLNVGQTFNSLSFPHLSPPVNFRTSGNSCKFLCPLPRHFPLSPDDFGIHIINCLVKYCLKITFLIGISFRFNGSLTAANPSKLFISFRYLVQYIYSRAIPITAIISRTYCAPELVIHKHFIWFPDNSMRWNHLFFRGAKS